MQRNWIGRCEGLLVRFALDPETTPAGESEIEDLHDAAGHAVRREVRGDRAGLSAGESFGREEPEARRVHRGVQRRGTAQAEARYRREEGLRHRHPRGASVRRQLAAAGLRRELHPDGLRHRRDLRPPGARPARPRLRQQVRSRQCAGGAAPGQDPKSFVITDSAYDGDGTYDHFALPRRHDDRAGEERSGEAAGRWTARQSLRSASAR